jgi:hypothetical protein
MIDVWGRTNSDVLEAAWHEEWKAQDLQPRLFCNDSMATFAEPETRVDAACD